MVAAPYIDDLRPSDAGELLRLARENGQERYVFSPGAHGVVVRASDSELRGFCLFREASEGLWVVDELWCEQSRDGVAALGVLAGWIEGLVAATARDRGAKQVLSGIIRLDNQRHKAALEHRGYAVIAEVLAKEFAP
jgi:hypothetical protein